MLLIFSRPYSLSNTKSQLRLCLWFSPDFFPQFFSWFFPFSLFISSKILGIWLGFGTNFGVFSTDFRTFFGHFYHDLWRGFSHFKSDFPLYFSPSLFPGFHPRNPWNLAGFEAFHFRVSVQILGISLQILEPF